MMNQFQARQGDIYFKACSKPDLSKLKKKTDNIFAFGEVTGHAHKCISHNISDYESYVDENGDIYILSNDKPIEVGHDEHSVITCPPHTWICISRQREFDPASLEKERRVAD
jgi:hypothetical protein